MDAKEPTPAVVKSGDKGKAGVLMDAEEPTAAVVKSKDGNAATGASAP